MFRCSWEILRLHVCKKVLSAFFRFMRLKTRKCAVKFRRILQVFSVQVLWKILGAYYRFLRPKMKLFAVHFRRHSEVFALWGLWKKSWTHFHDLCIQERSCFPWSSDAVWNFSACKFCRKSSGRIFTIYASKTKLFFTWSSDVFLKFSACKVHSKSFGRNFTIYASKNEAVFREVQTHARSSLPARFAEKILCAISRLMWPKTKLFAVKFRRMLEVFGLQVLQRKFWAQFHVLCVQKRSCLPWSSDAFSKFSVCKVHRISSGRIFTILCVPNEAVCCVV